MSGQAPCSGAKRQGKGLDEVAMNEEFTGLSGVTVTRFFPIIIFSELAIVRFRVFFAVFPCCRPNWGRFAMSLAKL